MVVTTHVCVCGKIIAYQKGSPDAFQDAVTGSLDLDGAYMLMEYP